MTSPTELALMRLVAQRIAGPRLPTPAEAVGWLTAAQAQDLPGALSSVALRTEARSRQAVTAALDAGEVVRTWPMRGTLHLIRAEDVGWLPELGTARALSAAARRRDQLGLDPGILTRARDLAQRALAGGRACSRDELLAAWQAGGLAVDRPRGYHLLGYLAQTGTVCLGPLRGTEQLVVLVDEWVPHRRALGREQALAELASRYFRGHGPATVQDLVRWAGITVADARAGLAAARPELARVELDGREYFLDPATPELLAAHRREVEGVFLLPGFDEFVLGYADRSAALPPAYADRIVPGGNGIFKPTVVSAGRIVGTWRHTGRGANRTVTAAPFEQLPEPVAEAIPEAYSALP